VADPQRHTLYFNDQDTIYASSNGGRTWKDIGGRLPQDQPVSALAAGGGSIVASLGTDGIYTSTDQGQAWKRTWPVSGPLQGPAVDLIVVDPVHPSSVLAVAGNQLLRSTDGGRTWSLAP
jgi:photosystem II stability/assembly factor-like uncharacterized protein